MKVVTVRGKVEKGMTPMTTENDTQVQCGRQIRNGLEYNSYTMNLDFIFKAKKVLCNIYDDLPLK